MQDELGRAQVRAVAAGSAYWRERFASVGKNAASFSGAAALEALPAVGERDVSPNGDAAAMASLVMHGGERQFALHSSGPQVRRAIRLRMTRRAAYRPVVDSENKPTSYAWTGLGFRYPLAYTRGDLDVVARAGARLWRVLGLSGDDAHAYLREVSHGGPAPAAHIFGDRDSVILDRSSQLNSPH